MIRTTLLSLLFLPSAVPAQDPQLATWFRDITETEVAPDGKIYACGYFREGIADLPIVPRVLGAPLFNDLNSNCFVACLSPAEVPVLQHMVVFGGSVFENALGIDLDTNAFGTVTAVHVTGVTDSTEFPVTTGSSVSSGMRAGYWMRFGPTLQLECSTLVDGPNFIQDIVSLGNGDALICGGAPPGTGSAIKHGALGGDDDGILVHGRMAVTPSGLAYQEVRRALIGGNGRDHLRSLALAADGSIFALGYTASTDYPTLSAFKSPPTPSYSGKGKNRTAIVLWDFSLQRFSPQFGLTFCSPIGGSDGDNGDAEIKISGQKLAFACGTSSTDFVPAPQGVNADSSLDGRDAVVIVFDASQPGAPAVSWCSFFGGGGNERAHHVRFDTAGRLHVGGQTNAAETSTGGKGKKDPPPPAAPFPILDNGNGLIVNLDPVTSSGGFYSVFSPVSGGYELDYSSLTGASVTNVAVNDLSLGESVVLTMWPFSTSIPITTTANAPLSSAASTWDSFVLVTSKKAK